MSFVTVVCRGENKLVNQAITKHLPPFVDKTFTYEYIFKALIHSANTHKAWATLYRHFRHHLLARQWKPYRGIFALEASLWVGWYLTTVENVIVCTCVKP